MTETKKRSLPMADRKDDVTAKPVSPAASLIKTSNDASVELTEDELGSVSGGVVEISTVSGGVAEYKTPDIHGSIG